MRKKLAVAIGSLGIAAALIGGGVAMPADGAQFGGVSSNQGGAFGGASNSGGGGASGSDHLGDVRGGMQVVGVDEGQTEPRRQLGADERFAGARGAHHHDSGCRRHAPTLSDGRLTTRPVAV